LAAESPSKGLPDLLALPGPPALSDPPDQRAQSVRLDPPDFPDPPDRLGRSDPLDRRAPLAPLALPESQDPLAPPALPEQSDPLERREQLDRPEFPDLSVP